MMKNEMEIIFPSTGQNKKQISGLALHFIFHRFLPFFQALDKTKTDKWFSSPPHFSSFVTV